MGYVSIPVDVSGEIATHAALAQNVHGAGAHDILDSNDLTGYSKIITGTYAGNNTANRAIAHGLGKTPLFIFYVQHDVGAHCIYLYPSWMHFVQDNLTELQTVTQVDGTNFYVGNANNYGATANANTKSYTWVAIG